jgi:1-acyl-sn-glycerol-3-phosphate acyltransferase
MRGLLRYSVEFVVRLFFWLSVENRPKLAGAYILAPNHTSFLDPIVLQCAMHRHITFIIDAAIFRVKPFNWVYRLWNALPVTAGGSAKGALKGALHAVEKGEVIGIFPEGQISKTGELLPGMAGVALLMKRAQVPVVPVAIFGAFKILPRHASFPRPGRLRVVFGGRGKTSLRQPSRRSRAKSPREAPQAPVLHPLGQAQSFCAVPIPQKFLRPIFWVKLDSVSQRSFSTASHSATTDAACAMAFAQLVVWPWMISIARMIDRGPSE